MIVCLLATAFKPFFSITQHSYTTSNLCLLYSSCSLYKSPCSKSSRIAFLINYHVIITGQIVISYFSSGQQFTCTLTFLLIIFYLDNA